MYSKYKRVERAWKVLESITSLTPDTIMIGIQIQKVGKLQREPESEGRLIAHIGLALKMLHHKEGRIRQIIRRIKKETIVLEAVLEMDIKDTIRYLREMLRATRRAIDWLNSVLFETDLGA